MKKCCLFIAVMIVILSLAFAACTELLPGQEYGWNIEDSHLCFYTDGVKLTGPHTINGYDLEFTDEGYLKGNGQIQEVGYRHYVYVNENNIVLTGWQTINGAKYYFFPENGIAAVRGGREEPIKIDGAFYLFGDYGELMINNWGISYYGDSEGHPVTGYQTIDGINYLFDDKGKICTGLIEYNGAMHYFGYRNDGEAHGWVLDENDWYYFDPETCVMQTGNRTIDGIDYTFGADGKLIRTGTIMIRNSGDGYWYAYDENNNTVEGWQTINGNKYYFHFWGYALTGRQYIDDSYYYFSENGIMQTNCWGTEGSGDDCITAYFGPDGKQMEGWLTLGNDKYYFYFNLYHGFQEIDGDTYYFDENGKMQTGWVTHKFSFYPGYSDYYDATFYYGSDGKRVTGVQTIDGERYLLDPYVRPGLYYSHDLGAYYYCDEKGRIQTGWITDKDSDGIDRKYYFGEDGKAAQGFLTLGEDTYYLSPYVRTGTDVIWYPGGGLYRFDEETGKMVTGWYTSEIGCIFYYGPDGKRWDGLREIDGKYYFLFENLGAQKGPMCFERNDGNDIYYFFGDDGSSQTGWCEYFNKWYYHGSDYKRITGWLTLGNDTYYLNPERLENGTFRLEKDGKEDDFVFDKDGKLLGRKSELEVKPSEKPTPSNSPQPTSKPTPTNNPTATPKPTIKPTPSPETTDKVEAFVARCYSIILGRQPDAGGMKTWYNELVSGRRAASEIIDCFVRSQEFLGKNYNNADAVEILYKAMLGRGSDPAGKADWVGKLDAGHPFAVVINGFCGSKEFKEICDSYGITPGSVSMEQGSASDQQIRAFVTRCYNIILGRGADEVGMNTWFNELKSRRRTAAEIIEQFVYSQEFQNKKYSNPDAVEILYKAMLGRGSDPAGKADWVGKLNNGQPLTAIINGFCGSMEFNVICEAYGITPGSVQVQSLSHQTEIQEEPVAKQTVTKTENNVTKVEIVNPSDTENAQLGTAVQAIYVNEEKAKEFIGRCYRCILGREASQTELDGWIGQMLNGTKTADQIARGFLFSGEFKDKNVGNEELVKILYRVYMNREADAEGMMTWTQQLDEGTGLNELLNVFAKTNEFKAVVRAMSN